MRESLRPVARGSGDANMRGLALPVPEAVALDGWVVSRYVAVLTGPTAVGRCVWPVVGAGRPHALCSQRAASVFARDFIVLCRLVL
jgi:hypothetical protein